MSKKVRNNVLNFLEDKTNAYSERIALGMKSSYGWVEYTYAGLGVMTRKIASYLINNLEIKKEEKIAILSESKVEFGAAFFASILAGTTFVPLDIKLTINELTSILSDCMPSVMLASKAHLDMALKLKETIPSIKEIILLDNIPNEYGIKNIYTLPNVKQVKFRHRSMNSTALIIYTSGTTGSPKGVQTTFKNMYAQIKDLSIELNKTFKGEHINTLSILPMNHLFELTVGFMTFLSLGYSIYYSDNLRPKNVLEVMKSKKIKFMCTVPSFFKMLKLQFESEIAKESGLRKLLYNLKFHYIVKMLPFKCLKRYLFRNVYQCFGDEFFGFLSGGAPMDYEMGKYFKRIGINVYQGYGLSEASPVVSMDLTKNANIKSVGHKLSSFEVKIDESTGELMVKGPSVMKGYYKRDDLTQEVIEPDGWLHTGDIARIDRKGNIFITGRIKNMIVLSGGKKVFPEEVEKTLENCSMFKEFCILGTTRQHGEKKGTEEVTAVIVPSNELYEKYDDNTVEKMVTTEVKKLTSQLTQYKRPTNIIVKREELPKTATKKIKRREVKELVELEK